MTQDKPKIHLNLDTIEREDRPEPFAVVLGGKRYVMIDAQEVDYRELIESQQMAMRGEPERALAALIEEDQRDAFLANKLPNWKLEQLFTAYNRHHGLPTPGE